VIGVNDRDLIERCQNGERDAQRVLFERTSERIYRLLLRMTGNADDASDLTQDTYLKGFQRLGQFDGRSAISSWFYRIAVNEALQFRRRRNLGAQKLKELAMDQPRETCDPVGELSLDIDDALAELSAEDRAILLLKYQEEFDYRGIAEVMACAEGTVASRLNRARERLRNMLRKSYG
jgi:RNA polymerase sigma-70 factor (ECF subfamily)